MFKNNKKTMKTIVFSLVLAALTLTANNLNAQDRGLFGMGKSSVDYDYNYNSRGLLDATGIPANDENGFTNADFGEEAPLGSGIAILIGACAGYAVVRRKRSRKNTALLLACVLLLGFTQCKKDQPEPQDEQVRITLNVENGGKATDGTRVNVDPYHSPMVTFESGDQILVVSDGKYVGVMTCNGAATAFVGDLSSNYLVEGQPLYFYFLGNKIDVTTLTPGSTEGCTVNISDQAEKLPVISMGKSNVNYSSGTTSYSSRLYNKASLMKFNVTTPSNATICIKGMNNEVTINFANPTDNGFTFGMNTTDGGLIKMPAKDAQGVTWAIVLPQNALNAGTEGSAYTEDGIYVGARAAVPAITMNQFIDTDRPMTVNTFTTLGTPLTFEAKTAGATVTFSKGSSFTGTVQYSTNGGRTWSDYSSAISLANVGDKVMFRGNNNVYYSGSASKFNCSQDCYIYGNIMSLVSSTSYPTATTFGNTAFREMFKDNSHLKSHATKHLILPATSLTGSCYQYMFQNCTGLTTPPLMLATSATGGNNCNGMFNGCTALTSLPELHLTILGNYCFQGTFSGCTSLTSVPEDYLPFTTLTPACYMNMFQGCTGLTNVPNLPATTLQPRCYYHMFEGCTSLTALPSNLLPATTLADVQDTKGCYEGMFMGCTGLTSVPNLPATELTERCYLNMFRGAGMTTVPNNMLGATKMANSCCASMFRECPNLTNTPEIFATKLAESCCDAMFYHSAKITSAAPLHATTLVTNCYKNLFNGCSLLASVTCYATDISATNCTYIWLADAGKDVTGTKTIYTPSTTAWPNNTSGIPSGWTRVNL